MKAGHPLQRTNHSWNLIGCYWQRFHFSLRYFHNYALAAKSWKSHDFHVKDLTWIEMNQRQLEGWNFRWMNSAQEGLSSYPLHCVWIVSYVKPIRLSWALGVSPPPIASAGVFCVTQKVSYVSPSIWTSKAWAEGRWLFSRLSPHHGIVSRTMELCVRLVGTRFVQYRKQRFLSELEINLYRALPVLLLIHTGKPRL